MSEKTGYKEQRNLSAVQLLAEAPFFIASLLSALFSGTLLLYVDLMDSLSYIIRNAMVILLSNKLSKESYSVPVDEYSYVKSIHDWLMGILIF